MKNKKYLLFFSLLLFLNSCQSIKDGLQGNKKSKSAEEFLIEKKNPLILPPDFESMPKPGNKKTINIAEKKNKFDIKEIIKKSDSSTRKNSKSNNTSLEKSIIKIIKQN
tara:strand:- start:134 stop:460 length:327 start_codon:yes stop_codon:yes gene_type:complete